MAVERLAIAESVRQEAVRKAPVQRTVGVVFVHGVGEQEQTYALREHAGPLVKFLRLWYADRAEGFDVVSSHLSYGESTSSPSSLVLHLPGYDDGSGKAWSAENWVLTEGWWAARLKAPNLLEMASWTWKVFGFVLGRLVDASRPVVGGRTWLARKIEAVSGALLVTGYAIGAILGTPIVALLFVLAQIPISWIERVALAALRPLLLDGIGDFYVYLYDDIQAKHVRRGVVEAVRWLAKKHDCAHVIVVAHSQGTVVAYDALGNRAGDPSACVHDDLELRRVQGLVTLGAALGNAWRRGVGPTPARRLTSELCGHVRWVDAWTSYDFVNGGELKLTDSDVLHQMPKDSVGITNGQNMLTDHGGYFANLDEYAPLLAQMIESPDHWPSSRFWRKGGLDRRSVVRRRDRVTTLVGWRLAAMGAFALAVLFRAAVGLLPGDAALLAAIVAAVPPLSEATKIVAPALDLGPGPIDALLDQALAIIAWAGLCSLLYLVITRVVFDPWSEREMARAAGRDAPEGRQTWSIVFRSVFVIIAIAFAALVVAFVRLLAPEPRLWAAFLSIVVWAGVSASLYVTVTRLALRRWVPALVAAAILAAIVAVVAAIDPSLRMVAALAGLVVLWWMYWGIVTPGGSILIEAVDVWLDRTLPKLSAIGSQFAGVRGRLGRAPAG